MTTNDNTTARQAGLTDEQIADAIPLTAMIVYGAVSGDPKTVRMNLGELREFAANILAAQSADASIYQELDPSGLWEDISKERFDELKIRSDVRVRAFGQSADARNGEGVTLTPEDLEPMLVAANVPVEVWEEVMDFAAMLLAAPAAPAPTDLAPCIGQCGNAVLASGDRICHECREAAPAPAAPADDDTESIAYQAGYEAGIRRAARQQSATPAEPVRIEARVTANTPWMHILACEVANCQARGWEVRKLYATPADAASQADVRAQGFKDCIDAIRGAIEFGKQRTNHAPTEHWLAEFWHIGLKLAASEADKRDSARLDWLIENVNCDEIDNLPALPWGLSLDDHRKAFRDAVDEAIQRERQQGAQSNG